MSNLRELSKDEIAMVSGGIGAACTAGRAVVTFFRSPAGRRLTSVAGFLLTDGPTSDTPQPTRQPAPRDASAGQRA